MTRERADDYGLKKQTILDKAAALIARKGFDQATMMDVAKACGASKSHVYHYFPSKEELLFEIANAHITAQAAELQAIVALPLPAEERLARFVDSFVQGAVRSRSEHLILTHELKFLPRGPRERIRRLEIEMTRLLVQLLREVNPAVMAEPHAQTPYALLLYGMMIWISHWYSRSGPIAPKELAERIADLFANGFRTLQPRPPAA